MAVVARCYAWCVVPSVHEAFEEGFRASGAEGEVPLEPEALDAALAAAASGADAYPVDRAALAWALGETIGSGVAADEVDAGELMLALACADEHAPAVTALHERYLEPLRAHLRHLGLDDDAQADVLQVTRQRLLLPAADGPPRLVGYAGRGQLRALVRVVATRAGLDAKRSGRRKREVSLSDLTQVLMASADPELAAAAAHKKEVFRDAFEAAVSGLDASERTVLRLYAVDGVGIDGVAAAYGVHRSTAARRLAKVRESIREGTNAELQRRGVTQTELHSILAVVDEGLELTLSRILAEPFDATIASGSGGDD